MLAATYSLPGHPAIAMVVTWTSVHFRYLRVYSDLGAYW